MAFSSLAGRAPDRAGAAARGGKLRAVEGLASAARSGGAGQGTRGVADRERAFA